MTARAAQLVRLLGSEVDGEALAACWALGRMLRTEGRDWHWLSEIIEHQFVPAAGRPEWQLRAETLLKRGGLSLSPNVRNFLNSIAQWPTEPSARQQAWMDSIAVSVEERAA